ncbi:hypothetical protein SDC9_198609 [bioreactor metagenome]|uniref:Uncharacterized protein n=1 Tax=bioreactor metagenome TaxID=1076179 RepID=A0A645II37_9ZZZZ
MGSGHGKAGEQELRLCQRRRARSIQRDGPPGGLADVRDVPESAVPHLRDGRADNGRGQGHPHGPMRDREAHAARGRGTDDTESGIRGIPLQIRQQGRRVRELQYS